jgi:hypothetical protein
MRLLDHCLNVGERGQRQAAEGPAQLLFKAAYHFLGITVGPRLLDPCLLPPPPPLRAKFAPPLRFAIFLGFLVAV